MPTRVLVAGAGGVLGRLIARTLAERGHAVRSVVRRAGSQPSLAGAAHDVRVLDGVRPGAWAGACDGVDAVVSVLGASVDPSPLIGRKPYTRVDAPANIALLAEARRAGVRRCVYVSLIDGARSRSLDYAEGHERVVDAMRDFNMSCTVLRPTGFFRAMAALVDFARRGVVPVIGRGDSRTNPIHEHDLALAAADAVALTLPGLTEIGLGGPDVFTRRRIAEMAFECIGKEPRLLSVPVWSARAGGHALRLINPRAGHFTLFAAHVMSHDCLAPSVGRNRLDEYFRLYAKRRDAPD